MNTLSSIFAAVLDKDDNENPNAKWITIHPNKAGDGKGKHICLNGKGEIIKGNPHLVKALKDEGAKVSPEATVAINASKETPKFTDAQVEKFAKQYFDCVKPYDPEYYDVVKAFVAKHPEYFQQSLYDPSTLAFVDGKLLEGMQLIDAEKDKLMSLPKEGGAGEPDGDFTPPKDEDFEDIFEEGDFAPPKDDEFAGLLEDDPPAATVGGGNPPFTDEQIAEFAEKWGGGDGDKIEAIKAIYATNPELFTTMPDTDDKVWAYDPDALNDAIADYLSKKQTEPSPQNNMPPEDNVPPKKDVPKVPAEPVSAELLEGGYPFPKDAEGLNGLTKVKELGGASGANATLYKDANGNLFVMKRFAPNDKKGQLRIKEECDADAYYLAGGANVPHFKLYGDEKFGYTKLSQYIPNTKTLGSAWGSADDALKAKIKEGLRKSFALDVMAGAWDVLGTGQDNILVDNDGNVYRCDNGGAFNRRAQGGEKTEEQWGNGHIDDLWTMRGKSASLDGKTVADGTGKSEFFGDITTHQLLSDIASRDWDKLIAHLPEGTRQVMEKRIANAKEYHSVCDNVVTDGKYGDGQHSEDITLNYHCLNKFGAKVGCTNQNVNPKNWGWLRGDGGGNPAPTLSQFLSEAKPKLEDFTNLPEPQLAQYLPNGNVNEAASVLKTAGISINSHLYVKKDGQPNGSSVSAALALKPKLEAVAKGGDANAQKAKEMLAYVNKIEQMKADGFPFLTEEMPHSPSGAVDLNTPESKAAAEQAFNAAHADWENNVANAKSEFAKAEKAWQGKEAKAKQQLADATKKWEAENGKNTFKWKNVTACFEDFCKQNGIESHRFWDMAKSQGGSSQSEGSCHMKVLEILAMGGNLDHPYTSVKGVSDHTYKVKAAADEYKTHPDWLQRDLKAYLAMKSLTMMILQNSSFVGNFKDRAVLRLCRTESKSDVINGYGIQKGVPTVYNMGAHESFGVFKTATPFNNEAVFCDVPYSRVSSLYFLLSPKNGSMYLGDGENEAGVNAIGIPKVYWKHVHAGVALTDAWEFYEQAMEKPIVYAKSKNSTTSE